MKSCRESGDFARGGVAMDRALCGGAIKRLGRELERFLGGGTVAGSNRFGRPFDRAVNAGLDQTVAGLALHALAMALLGGRMIRDMRHNLYDLTAADGAVNIAHQRLGTLQREPVRPIRDLRLETQNGNSGF